MMTTHKDAVDALLRDMQSIAAGAITIPAREFAMHALADYSAAAKAGEPPNASHAEDEPNWLTWERLKDMLAIFVVGACNNPERESLTTEDWAGQLDRMAARQTAYNPLREIKAMLAEKSQHRQLGD